MRLVPTLLDLKGRVVSIDVHYCKPSAKLEELILRADEAPKRVLVESCLVDPGA